jgi:hypothetical protein
METPWGTVPVQNVGVKSVAMLVDRQRLYGALHKGRRTRIMKRKFLFVACRKQATRDAEASDGIPYSKKGN